VISAFPRREEQRKPPPPAKKPNRVKEVKNQLFCHAVLKKGCQQTPPHGCNAGLQTKVEERDSHFSVHAEPGHGGAAALLVIGMS
jgi:hypothetical protein